jgi:hypothetical protein
MPLTRSAAKRAMESEARHSSLNRQETLVTISTSATGQGTHTRWVRSSSANTESEPDPLSSLLPATFASSVGYVNQRFVTPAPRDSFDAGSVVRTPMKKLTRANDRIGPTRIDFWHDQNSEFKAFTADGGGAAVPHVKIATFQIEHPRVSTDEYQPPRGPEGTILNIEELGSPFQSRANLLANDRRRLQPADTENVSNYDGSALELERPASIRLSGRRRRIRIGPCGTEIIETV